MLRIDILVGDLAHRPTVAGGKVMEDNDLVRHGGLSQADQSKLWGKFVRLTPRPTGGETSNGLGLWIVDRLAKSMNGNVFCKSEL